MLTSTEITGIALGLGAAFFQASSYVASRRFLTECRPSTTSLFSASHTQMGLFSLAALPFLMPETMPPVQDWLGPLLGTSAFYLFGQWFLFQALQKADSSKVSPLLGLKIPILAVISTLFLQLSLPPLAWLAVAVCTLAAFSISPPTALPGKRTLGLTSAACIGYCLSDLSIPVLVEGLKPASERPVLLGVCLVYLLCGAAGFITCTYQKQLSNLRIQSYALPHAFTWLTGMICLFGCFSRIGVIPGNMLQSTRGIISVLLGVGISRLGLLHLDSITTRHALIRRLTAAVFMAAAISLYLYAARTI